MAAGEFDKMVDSGGFLDLFDYPFKKDDLELIERDFSEIASTLQSASGSSRRQVSSARFGYCSPLPLTCVEHLASALRSRNCVLETLQFIHNEIGTDGMLAIVESLKVNKTLTTLELIVDNFAPCAVRALAEVLSCNQVLSSLILQNTAICSGSGIDCMCDALKGNSTLRLLDLSDNSVNDHGALALSRVLAHNCTLTSLSLNNAKIGALGMRHLGMVLRDNRGLQHLSLQHNHPSADGAREFAGALKHNKTLLTMNLSHCELTDDQCLPFTNGLKQNDTLQTLALSHNLLTDKGANSLLLSLKINLFLKTLSLDGNTVSHDLLQKISNTIRRNFNVTKLAENI